ncbi:MAG: hypothetical protein P8P49_01095 [Opitutales bacterium]|nr:hypothetical protein [Opitutales bacterium]MDG1324331.1 hypothetical protein [Opitutales bacterium]
MIKLDQFVRNISSYSEPHSNYSDCLKALWWVQKGDWVKAHDIAQDEGTMQGDWIHAYLHRLEGDLGNAAYWYSRASRPVKQNECLDEEWKEIAVHFLSLEPEI